MQQVELSSKVRGEIEQGTGASRRLRRANKIPAIVYGGGSEPAPITLDHNEFFRHLNHEGFVSSIITLNTDGQKELVLLRDIQMHPFKPIVFHVDFQRVNADEKIHLRVPLHFINQDVAPGVKLSGGIVNHIATDLEISCLPKDLPESITVDLANLVAGHSIHISELKLPAGVESVALAHGHDDAVASISAGSGE